MQELIASSRFPERSSRVGNPVKTLGLALLLLPSSCFCLLAFRFVSLPFVIASWILFIRFAAFAGREWRPSFIACAVALVQSFSPIDIFPLPRRGLPRLIPLVMGLPRPETLERAKRGEVILGGCLVSGFEPKYYV